MAFIIKSKCFLSQSLPSSLPSTFLFSSLSYPFPLSLPPFLPSFLPFFLSIFPPYFSTLICCIFWNKYELLFTYLNDPRGFQAWHWICCRDSLVKYSSGTQQCLHFAASFGGCDLSLVLVVFSLSFYQVWCVWTVTLHRQSRVFNANTWVLRYDCPVSSLRFPSEFFRWILWRLQGLLHCNLVNSKLSLHIWQSVQIALFVIFF